MADDNPLTPILDEGGQELGTLQDVVLGTAAAFMELAEDASRLRHVFANNLETLKIVLGGIAALEERTPEGRVQ